MSQRLSFGQFLRWQLQQRQLSLQQMADLMTRNGYVVAKATIGHWARGRNHAPLNDAVFRRALLRSIQMDEATLLCHLGYLTCDDKRTPEGRLAAEIVDGMDEASRKVATDMLAKLADALKRP